MSNLECVSVNDEGTDQREISNRNYGAQGPMYNIRIQGVGALHAGNAVIPAALNESLITIEDVTDFKNKLREFYKELTLPRMVWLDEEEDLNIDEYFIELKLRESGATITKEDIFNPVELQRPTRILMEGQPGSGKTSLATRIVYDWANAHGYVDQFELVFLLPLRELQQQSVDDAIKSIGGICGFKDSDKIDEIVSRNEQHVLFIFDGLDELSVEDRTPILKLLYKQKYIEVTMLITCRTGLFTLTKDEHKHLFQGMNRQSSFYNKKISIFGIKNDEKKMEFLEKFIMVDESVKHNVVANLKSRVSGAQLFDCPLFLILLAFIVNTEEENGETLSTATELYKKLFNCIIKHSCLRNQIPIKDCFDLFDCESSSNDLREVIKEFGKLSLQHILENNLQFKSDRLTEQIYKVGFLCNHKQVIRFKSNQYYEVFHLSILEFSAAYYVWREYKSNESDEFMEKILKALVQHYFTSRGTSLVLGFMIGLFQEHSRDIFDGMRSFSCFFASNPSYIEQLMKECPSADVYKEVFPVMTHFLPVQLVLKTTFVGPMLLVESFEKLIEYGIKCGKIKCVHGSNFFRTPSLKTFHAPCVKVILDGIEDLHDIFAHLANNIDELHITIPTMEPSRANLIKIASTIEPYKSARCSVKLHFDEAFTSNQIYVPFEEMCEINLYSLTLEIRTPIQTQFIITLLPKIQILKVYLGSEELDLTDLLNAIANSSCLLHFAFDTRCEKKCTVIDLSDLTKGGTKRYEYLEFKNCNVICSQPLINRNCVNILSIDGILRDTLYNIEPTNLLCRICDVSEFFLLNFNFNFNLPVNSIKYIKIVEESRRRTNVELVFSFLSNCKNLRILEISSKLFQNPEYLVEGLMKLEIEKFVYIHDSFEILNVFKIMNDNWPVGGKMKLQCIDIIFNRRVGVNRDSDTESILPTMFEVMKGLLERRWKRVNFVCCDIEFFVVMANDKSVIDVSIFDVVHYTYGSDNDDPDYYKFQLNRNGVSVKDAFAITLK